MSFVDLAFLFDLYPEEALVKEVARIDGIFVLLGEHVGSLRGYTISMNDPLVNEVWLLKRPDLFLWRLGTALMQRVVVLSHHYFLVALFI